MRRQDHVGRVPQRVASGQGFRIGDVERGAGEPGLAVIVIVIFTGIGMSARAPLQRGDELVLAQDLAARDVGDEGLALGQDGEFGRAQQMARLRRERHADEQVVDVLREEAVQRWLVEAREPGRGEGSVRVARVRHDEAAVLLRLGRWPGARGVCDHVHAHGAGDARDLAPDAAVAEHAQTQTDSVAHFEKGRVVGVGTPRVGFLVALEELIFAGMRQGREEHPDGVSWDVL